MTVYVVMAWDYGDVFIAAVYDTKEQADIERDRQAIRDTRKRHDWSVDPIELNTPFEWKRA